MIDFFKKFCWIVFGCEGLVNKLGIGIIFYENDIFIVFFNICYIFVFFFGIGFFFKDIVVYYCFFFVCIVF